MPPYALLREAIFLSATASQETFPWTSRVLPRTSGRDAEYRSDLIWFGLICAAVMADDLEMTDTFVVFEPKCYQYLFDCSRSRILSTIAGLGISYLISPVRKRYLCPSLD
jgi:hypothetical protein